MRNSSSTFQVLSQFSVSQFLSSDSAVVLRAVIYICHNLYIVNPILHLPFPRPFPRPFTLHSLV